MAKKVAKKVAKKAPKKAPKKSATSRQLSTLTTSREIIGCAHIMQNNQVPPLRDNVGDRYLSTTTRDILISRFTPQVDFPNTDLEFETMFAKDTNAISKDFQEIMFFLKDETNPNPQTDRWMAYDRIRIEQVVGNYFILQRKFFDGQFSTPKPADGFKFVTHRSIVTKLGRHEDGSLCILVCIVDADGNIINDHGNSGEPEGVGSKIPPDPE